MRYWIIYLGCLFNMSIVFGQDVQILKEFKALNAHYAKMTSFGIDIAVQYLDSKGKVAMSQTGQVLYNSQLHFIDFAGSTTLIRDDKYVMVNKDYKQIVFNTQKDLLPKKPKGDFDISSQLDSLWKNQTNLSYKIIQSKPGTLRVFIADKNNENFDAYEIIMDTKKKQLLEYRYYFKQNDEQVDLSQVRIYYSNETAQPKLNLAKLKVDYYVQQVKNRYQPSSNFAGYQLIDQAIMPKSYE